MKTKKLKYLTLISVMSGLSFVLYYFELPVGFLFPAAPFLKIDFSDIPAIFTAISLGPVAGVIVEAIKNVLHFIFISKEPAASGEIANFLAGIAYLIPVSYIARKNYKKFIIPSMVFATVFSAIVMGFVNYYITLPLYGMEESLRIPVIISTFFPFNLLRGFLISIVVYFLYPKVKSIVKSYNQN